MRLSVKHVDTNSGSRRTVYLTGTNSVEIFFEFDEALPPPIVLDGFVMGAIFHAMRQRTPLVVEGPMTRDALLNITTFQEAWTCWLPEVYRPVQVLPSSIIDSLPVAPCTAIVAFSGGVDSIFAAVRHAKRENGEASYPVTSALMVHGFDVQLDRADHFHRLIKRVRPLLDELGLRLRTVRTNIKMLDLASWQDSFLAQLACCLHNFSHDFRYGVTGSGEPYNALILPWGQNPCTDHLLSGSNFSIAHDGAGFSRTDKIAFIAKHATAARTVKVCWEGEDAYTNCGRCEKCLRTRMNFMAVGIANPACFDTPFNPRDIEAIKLDTLPQFNELAMIAAYAEGHGSSGAWLDALRRRLRRPIGYRSPAERARNLMTNIRRGEFSEIARKISRRLGA